MTDCCCWVLLRKCIELKEVLIEKKKKKKSGKKEGIEIKMKLCKNRSYFLP